MTPRELFATYSIVAADADEIGAAVQTHQMCVGSVVPWLLPGVGAVVTQSLVNVSLGPLGLEMLAAGSSPECVVTALEALDREPERRQFAVINSEGAAAAFTGSGCIREASHSTGSGFSVQANMMLTTRVVDAMAAAYQESQGPLAERLLLALMAAQRESGDIRGMQSAALATVANDTAEPAWRRRFDLRVDEHDSPLAELDRLVRFQRANYIDIEGHTAVESGDVEQALRRWKDARELAPELEELPFWQAVTLADKAPGYSDEAAEILRVMLANEANPHHWVDLIHRLVVCGLLTSGDIAEKLHIQ